MCAVSVSEKVRTQVQKAKGMVGKLVCTVCIDIL